VTREPGNGADAPGQVAVDDGSELSVPQLSR
jgi:hypothetical protein